MTPASEKAPEGVTHKTHYTMAEVMSKFNIKYGRLYEILMSKFNIKYGRLYEIRNRYQLASVHAWGTTAFRKKDVEKAIAKYDEEQGKAQQEAYSSMPGVRPLLRRRMSRKLLPSTTKNRARRSRKHITPVSTSCRSTVWVRRKYAVLLRRTVSASRKPRAAGLTSTLRQTGKRHERKLRRQVPAPRRNGHEAGYENTNVGTTCSDD